jgi:hypothetical protein
LNSSFPKTAVVRVSKGNFDPDVLRDVAQMTVDTSTYLLPAITKLAGLLAYYAGVSPDGSMVHVSVWDSEEHANQMGSLPEMITRARSDAVAAGVTFTPIINYPISWQV